MSPAQPPPLPPSAPKPRPWGRPDNVLGEPLALSFLLARSESAAIQVQHVTAFPAGFEFQLVAHYIPTGRVWDPMHGLGGLTGRAWETAPEPSDEHLRLRLRFSDGSEANNLGPPMMAPTDPVKGTPFLQPGSGGARRSIADTTYWVWPLPPAGSLVFACEWPMYHIPATQYEVNADLIRQAAARAVELWPADSDDA